MPVYDLKYCMFALSIIIVRLNIDGLKANKTRLKAIKFKFWFHGVFHHRECSLLSGFAWLATLSAKALVVEWVFHHI